MLHHIARSRLRTWNSLKFVPPVSSNTHIKNWHYITWPPKAKSLSMAGSPALWEVWDWWWADASFTQRHCSELIFKGHWCSLGHLSSEKLWISDGGRENLEPFRKENVGHHMISQLQALSSAFQLSEGPQERKSISAQLRTTPILQTLLSLVEPR